MKTLLISSLTLFLCLLLPAQTTPEDPLLSEKLEMQQTISKGAQYLLSKQNPEGYWGDKNLPAFTAFALRSLLDVPRSDEKNPYQEATSKGLNWLIKQQKADGGIYGKGLATYNTSSSIMALLASGDKNYHPIILKARGFLVNQQTDWGIKGELDGDFDGGIGYGGTYAHSDLSNTHLALEALYHSKQLITDNGEDEERSQPDLDWEAALAFVTKCQNLRETNKMENSGNDGSFVYFPGNSKAGSQEEADGRVSLRGYGSMSYAGLLSLVYADLKEDDPRLKTVLEWLRKNYTLEENPGLEGQGLYYYYHTMAKALTAANIPTLEMEDGTRINWRKELASKILSTQREDGSWINPTSRWMENDPILVTCYALMTLEQIHATLK